MCNASIASLVSSVRLIAQYTVLGHLDRALSRPMWRLPPSRAYRLRTTEGVWPFSICTDPKKMFEH